MYVSPPDCLVVVLVDGIVDVVVFLDAIFSVCLSGEDGSASSSSPFLVETKGAPVFRWLLWTMRRISGVDDRFLGVSFALASLSQNPDDDDDDPLPSFGPFLAKLEVSADRLRLKVLCCPKSRLG